MANYHTTDAKILLLTSQVIKVGRQWGPNASAIVSMRREIDRLLEEREAEARESAKASATKAASQSCKQLCHGTRHFSVCVSCRRPSEFPPSRLNSVLSRHQSRLCWSSGASGLAGMICIRGGHPGPGGRSLCATAGLARRQYYWAPAKSATTNCIFRCLHARSIIWRSSR